MRKKPEEEEETSRMSEMPVDRQVVFKSYRELGKVILRVEALPDDTPNAV